MKRRSGKIARHRQPAPGGQLSRAVVDRLEPRCYLTVTFGNPTFYTGVAGGADIAGGDFNADGKPDIVVSGLSPTVNSMPVVGVYLNNAGAFSNMPLILPFSGTPSGVGVGDFTSDGKSDIVVVDSTTNHVFLYAGSGTGTFIPGVGTVLAGNGGATSMAVADFNGDKFDDIAVAEPPQNQVELQFSKGNGSFAAESIIPVPAPKKVIAIDVSGDGHPDLVIASGTGSVYVALNTGTGTFAAPVGYGVGTTLTSVNDLAVADVNGDSLPDLIAVGDTGTAGATGTATILFNQGGGLGTFLAAAPITTPIDPADVVIGKLAGSIHADLGLIGASGALDIVPGNGDGTFGAALPIFTTQLNAPLGPALAADLNSDGMSDIAYVSPSQSGIGVIVNTTNGSVTPPPPPTMPTPSPLVPALIGKLPTLPQVAGGKIATIREVVRLTNSSPDAISGSITLNLVLATTAAGETGDPVIATTTKTVTIKPSKSKTFALPVKKLPAGIQGPYYILAEVTDPSTRANLIPSAATISVVAPTIDLSGAFVTMPATAKAGRNAGFTFSITNSGTVALSKALPITIQSSATPGIDSTSMVIDSPTKKVSIKPGRTIRMHVSKSISTTAGSYYLVVQLDPGNTLGDVNTSNNMFATVSPIAVS